MARIVGGEPRGAPRCPPAWRGSPDTGGLRPYQIEGVLWLRSRTRALLADEMRLGKTAQALRALEPPAMILGPASAKHVWAAECARWRPDLRVIVSEPGELRLPVGGSVAIGTYDSLPVPEERARGAWLVPFDLGPVTLVLDEVHLLKSASARRSGRARTLAAQCGRVWGLTGTPLPGRPPDLWGVLSACGLAREAFGSFEAFARLFGGRLRVLPPAGGRTRRFWEWRDGPPSSTAIEAFSRVALRRLRRDVAPDMPARTHRDVRCELAPELAAELDRADWPEGSELPPLTMFSGVRARVAEARVQPLMDLVAPFEATWAREVPPEERIPVVVFSAHRNPIDALGSREGWGRITGEMPAELRRAVTDAFRAGLIHGVAATIGAGGVAIDLSRADHAIFVDRSFTPADNEQAEDRLAAVGKTRPIHVDRLVSAHPLDLRVQEILDAKQGLIAGAVRT